MGKDLYEDSAEVRELYELASDLLRVDIANLSFNGPADELKKTIYTQPAILLHSLAVIQILGSDLPPFEYAAGHSLGEYGALAVAGAISFEDAVAAVVRRATLMESACQLNPGTMAAVMGLSDEQLERVCTEASAAGVVVPANYNSNSQTVISGSVAGVGKACELDKAAGAKRAILLEVGGAFHSPLMRPAQEGLKEFLRSVTLSAPRKPVVANVSARPFATTEEIRRLLAEQVTSPVKWAQTMAYLKDSGVTRVIEIGPGKVLTGMAKREMDLEQMSNLDTLEDIRAFASVSV